MKLPNKELRAFIYNRLLNSITVGSVIPVCSVPAKTQDFPFIDLGNISIIENLSTKDAYITRCQIEINVYTQFADENTSYTQCEEISSAITERLINFKGDTTNFNIDWARFISSNEVFEQTETVKAISNTIIVEYLCEQI